MLAPRSLAVAPVLLALIGCGGDDARPAEPEGGGATFVHNLPGELVVSSPARAAFVEETSDGLVAVTGTGASAALEIDGVSVTPSADGSFTTSVAPAVGLNVLRVVDGEHAVDVPYLYGRFAAASEPVPAAVAVRINALGFDDPDESRLSLTLLANRALEDVDLLAALQDQTFTGDIPGGSWKFHVESASYGRAEVELGPRQGGAEFTATVADVRVDGKLTIEVLIADKTDDVTLTADAAKVGGDIEIGLEKEAASLAASAASVTTKLEGFQYDSDNAGFPCCVDDIMTKVLRSKIEKATQDKVQAVLSKKVAFALSQFSLPESLDLAGAGFPATIDLEEAFDGASFDAAGGRLTAAVRFHHDFGAADPGAAAPGWLTVGEGPGTMSKDRSFGVSVSLDALNQALYAAWGQNGLSRALEDLPLAGTVHLAPALPPVILASAEGGVVAGAGEIIVDAEISGSPVRAAITIRDDVEVTVDSEAHALVLTPGPTPLVSITWLVADGLSDGLRETIEAAILDQLPSLLTPVTLPLPTVPLGAIASSFGEATGAIGPGAELVVDATAGRAALSGELAILP